MDVHTSDHVLDVSSSVPGAIGRKVCKGGTGTCGLSSSGSGSQDSHERSASIRKLAIAIVLCIIFMAVEVVGGIKANSLAILTDAAHLLSDVAAFAISLFSIWASGWEATPRQSYGFYRIEILGALVSIQLIWLLTGILVYEAVVRLMNDGGEVHGVLMFAVATFGLVVNIVMAVLLGHDHGHSHGGHDHDHGHGGHGSGHESHGHSHESGSGSAIRNSTDHHQHHHHSDHSEHEHEHEEPLLHQQPEDDHTTATRKKQRNINVHSAYLHVLGDSIQSVGVMAGGAVIWYKPEWKVVDLVCTLIFSVVVLFTTIRMLRSILEVLMESTPREIDATMVEKGMCEIPGVETVHELHIWAITVGKLLLACHVIIKPGADADVVLDEVTGYIRREYKIDHATIQIERS